MAPVGTGWQAMKSDWLHRWRNRSGRAAAASSNVTMSPSTGVFEARTEVCPPSLEGRGQAFSGVRDWLVSGGIGSSSEAGAAHPHSASVTAQQLEAARRDFVEALDSLNDAAAEKLQCRIRLARTLRELWHLRLEVFQLVSLAQGQAIARQRLDRLDAHFETRAKRSIPQPLRAHRSRTSSW